MDTDHPEKTSDLPSLPEPVCRILQAYLAQMDAHLPDILSGLYLVGSIALDGYDPKFSDIDYVAVLSRPLTKTELTHLARVHREIEKAHPRAKLSGSYLQPADLGGLPEQVAPHPYYQDGLLYTAGHFELNPVTWWILKQRGITLRGPAAQALPFSADWERLAAYLKHNLNTYWLSWTKRLDGRLVMLSDWGIQWTVLGVVRLYYSLREKDITTKIEAGEYALQHLPPEWHPLIHEALRIRRGEAGSAYRWRLGRAREARRFLGYIIQEGNAGKNPPHP